ncbi:MAG: minor capsid protein, partial [Christensenella sp.]
MTDKIVTLNAAKKQIIALRKIFRGAQGELAAESEKILHSISGDTAEARRILSIAELSGLRNKYARMIEMLHDDKTAQMANRLMDTIYKTNRVTRMDAMTAQLDYYCAQLYGNSANVIKRLLVDTAQTSYLRKAFDFEQFAGHELSWAMIDARSIDVLIASRWSGKNWSNRLWGHVKGFDTKLKDIIGRGILTGEDTHVMAAELSKITNSTRNNAERIMRTETAFVAERAAQLAYEEFDVEKYQYLATLDLKTSEVCRDMDGRVFAREKAKTGINFPPLHPNCRSTTVPEFDDMDNDDMRAARDPVTGKTVYEKDMSYNDWYEKRVARRMEMPRSVGMPLKN